MERFESRRAGDVPDRVNVVAAEVEQITRAETVLSDGGVVVIPTDTVYGIAARVDIPSAVGRIFEIKKRPVDKALAVLVGDMATARILAVFSKEALAAAEKEWPGPLTIVLPRSDKSRGIPLGGDPATIGIRIPDHSFALELLGRVGPMAATSANVSGQSEAATVDEIAKSLAGVDLYVDAGPIKRKPSRVVSFVNGMKTLRE
jgi:L-threonylcarbamoyladenylate synthase